MIHVYFSRFCYFLFGFFAFCRCSFSLPVISHLWWDLAGKVFVVEIPRRYLPTLPIHIERESLWWCVEYIWM
jgi:hypothetical protein